MRKKHRQAMTLAKFLAPAERDVEKGRTRSALEFLKKFKRAKRI